MKRAIVVGSGAGGAMAARELTSAFEVTVLEAGPEFQPFGQDLGRVERLRSTAALSRSAHDPAAVSRDARDHGLGSHGTRVRRRHRRDHHPCHRQRASLRRGSAADRHRSGPESSRRCTPSCPYPPATNGAGVRSPGSCSRLARSWAWTRRSRRSWSDYSRCTRCGRCVLGCPTGAKWDSRDHLRQAVARGARLLTGAKVERVVLGESGRGPRRATGVVVRRGRRTESLAADLVVLAAGGLGTPAILGRSGLATEDRLFVDPVLCVAAPAAGVRAGRRGADALLRRGRWLHHLALLRLPELLLRPLVEAAASRHREPDDQAGRQRDRLRQPAAEGHQEPDVPRQAATGDGHRVVHGDTGCGSALAGTPSFSGC